MNEFDDFFSSENKDKFIPEPVKSFSYGIPKGFQLIHGDAIEEMKKIPDSSIDLCLTDIPYMEVNRNSNGIRNLDKGIADILNHSIESLLNEIIRITKGSIYIFCGIEQISEIRKILVNRGISTRLGIWEKTNPSPSSNRYHQIFEYILVFSKGKPSVFNGIKDRPNKTAGQIGAYGKNVVIQKDGTYKERPKKINTAYGLRTNIQRYLTTGAKPEERKWKHPAKYPLQLAIDQIITWTDPGMIVYDPFMGSFTSAIACLETGRNYIGSEIGKEYYQEGQLRLEDWHTKRRKSMAVF